MPSPGTYSFCDTALCQVKSQVVHVFCLQRQLTDARQQRETHAKARHKIEDECQALKTKNVQLEQEVSHLQTLPFGNIFVMKFFS